MGRPKFEITPEIIEKVEGYAANGLTKQQMADCLGISYVTFNERQKENPEFLDAIKRGQSKGIQEVSNALFQNAKKGNVVAQIFYLKNRSQHTWSDMKELRVAEKEDAPGKNLLDMPEQEFEEEYAAITGAIRKLAAAGAAEKVRTSSKGKKAKVTKH